MGAAGANKKIEGLKKVTLTVEAGTLEDRMDLTSDPNPYELVIGIGSEGFTPFEYAMLGKGLGDILLLEIHRFRKKAFFGHIDLPLPVSVRELDSFFLKITVNAIDDVDQTELVRAMAGSVSECTGDCCGNH